VGRVVGAVTALGGAAAVASVVLVALDGSLPHPLALVIVALVVGLGDLPIVHVRYGDDVHSFTWSEAALVAGLVLLPTWWLPAIGAIPVGVQHLLLRRPSVKALFNASSYAVGAFLATGTYALATEQLRDFPEGAALALAVTVFYASQTLSVSLVIARAQAMPVHRALRSGLLLATLFAIANASVAILVATAATREPLVLLTLPPVVVQLLFAYRNTREVIDERDLWVSVQELSLDLQRAATEEVAPLALRAAQRLVGADVTELLVVDGDRAERHRTRHGELDVVHGEPADLADDVWGRVECDRSSFWLHAPTASPRQRAWLRSHGVQSALVVPVEWGGTVIGLIRAGFSGRQGSPRAESVLSTLATQVASAVASHRQTAELVHQAGHDQLTGLPNRTLLVEQLGRRLSAVDGRTGVAVLFFDLDGFKIINDSLGHHVGDDVLLEAARRLRHAVRADDMVARFGGDEFVVVCAGVRGLADAGEIARGLLDALAVPTSPGVRATHISASAGLAFTDQPGTTAESMLRDADAAMYEAKRTVPGSFCAFNADLRTQVLERLHLEADLRVALEAGSIEVQFQPVVDANGFVHELEALARWHHPERGPISPAAFVSVAEQSGQIRRLGELVLQQACAEMRALLDLGLVGLHQRVAVNLSAQQLDSTLPTVVGDALARNGLPPTSLTLEVTESALVDDPDAVASLERLRGIGVSISLDDFGTGYSSLSALRDLPVDTVKIDRSFVARLTEDRQIEALVKGIVELAHALELRVVAEGVEETAQAATLNRFGCDYQQGWLHGRPMNAQLVEATLSGTRHLRALPDADALGA